MGWLFFLCEFSGSVHLLFFHKYGSAGRKPGSRDNLCSGIAAVADCSSRFSVGATWLAILPGSFYGIQVIRMTYKSGKIGFAEAVVHTVFQFFFLFDVLDAMYLATEKWGRGKKSSVIIGCVYLFAVFATIYLIIKMKSMF